MDSENIRNFSIVAHVDHGKSTLADRFLELTGTVPKREMRDQVLDMMDLERERGITIKMQPVRMNYRSSAISYQLNLIDTPGHIDFSYEVSRSLRAVEGVILLIDAAQGMQAQTFTVVEMVRELGLAIVPALNKIDLPTAVPAAVRQEAAQFLGLDPDSILAVSAKTGEGVSDLLTAVIERIPAPRPFLSSVKEGLCRGLVFDFNYSPHRGTIIYVRLFDGGVSAGDELFLAAAGEKFTAREVGWFTPQPKTAGRLRAGEIGYIVTGLKETGRPCVGDTVMAAGRPLSALVGYREPAPMVWLSLYPVNQKDFELLRRALWRLRLADAAVSFEEEDNKVLGRGFRCGFLGPLHLEIVVERLRREYGLELILASPTIGYQVIGERTGQKTFIAAPHLFPEDLSGLQILEPWVTTKVIVPPEKLSPVLQLLNDYSAAVLTTANIVNRLMLEGEMPLRELMGNFFSRLKSVSAGLASFSYVPAGYRPAAVVRLDVLLNDEAVLPLARVVAASKLAAEAKALVERLATLLPRQLINVKIQAKADGRIIASRTITARKKDVTGYLYGGDVTRKMKLRQKQKRGKKRMQAVGRVSIPPSVFSQMIKPPAD